MTCPDGRGPRDTPHDAAEADYADMTEPERLAVWAIRSWVAGQVADTCVHPILAQVFGRYRAWDVLPALDRLMAAIARNAVRSIDVRCPRCTKLSADETCFVKMLSCLQHGWPATAGQSLRGMIGETGIAPVLLAAGSMAQALREAGQLMTAQPDITPQWRATSDPGLGLRH